MRRILGDVSRSLYFYTGIDSQDSVVGDSPDAAVASHEEEGHMDELLLGPAHTVLVEMDLGEDMGSYHHGLGEHLLGVVGHSSHLGLDYPEAGIGDDEHPARRPWLHDIDSCPEIARLGDTSGSSRMVDRRPGKNRG
jgi:hypothetical protein